MAPYRLSPAAPRKAHHKSPHIKSKLGRHSQSPLLHRRAREPRYSVPPADVYGFNTERRGRNLGRILESPDRRRTRLPSAFNELEQELRQYSDAEEDEGNYKEEKSFFPWEDERTLVADLLHDANGEDDDDDEKALGLVESLQDSFSLCSKEILGDVADTLVPAVKRVKDAHKQLDDHIDREYGAGILDFNETCVKMEQFTVSEYEEVQTAHEASKKRVADLRKDLIDVYSRRERLWEEFERRIDAILKPAIAMLKELPSKTERSIADIEKQSKRVHKNDPGHDQTLKDILTKLM